MEIEKLEKLKRTFVESLEIHQSDVAKFDGSEQDSEAARGRMM